jgi:hypothetical protein
MSQKIAQWEMPQTLADPNVMKLIAEGLQGAKDED